MEEYDNNIPDIETEYSEIMQNIIDNVPLSVRVGMGRATAGYRLVTP